MELTLLWVTTDYHPNQGTFESNKFQGDKCGLRLSRANSSVFLVLLVFSSPLLLGSGKTYFSASHAV